MSVFLNLCIVLEEYGGQEWVKVESYSMMICGVCVKILYFLMYPYKLLIEKTEIKISTESKNPTYVVILF